jgi:hypothetical protein
MAGLKKAGKTFFEAVQADYAMEEAHDLARLEMAARCLDDIIEAEAAIKKDGAFVADRYGGTREHPAAKAIREYRALFLRIIRELALDLDVIESRPPRKY